jgi:hypothetical protein
MWSLGCIMAELLSKKANPLLQHEHTLLYYVRHSLCRVSRGETLQRTC